jgi:hypothetical protein
MVLCVLREFLDGRWMIGQTASHNVSRSLELDANINHNVFDYQFLWFEE